MCVTLISVDGACKEFASLARAAWRGDESSLERFIAAVERSQKYLESKEITLFAVWTCNLRTQDRKPRIGEGAEPCRTRTKRIERIRAAIRRADKDCSSRYRNGSSGVPPRVISDCLCLDPVAIRHPISVRGRRSEGQENQCKWYASFSHGRVFLHSPLTSPMSPYCENRRNPWRICSLGRVLRSDRACEPPGIRDLRCRSMRCSRHL